MATIITTNALKKILKKFQNDVIFKKYDDKIAQITQKNLDQDNSISALETNLAADLEAETTRAINKETELSGSISALETNLAADLEAETTRAINKETELSGSISALETGLAADLEAETTRAINKETELSETKVDMLSLSTDKSILANSYNAVLIIATEALELTYPNTSGTDVTQALTAGSMTILAKSGSGYTNSIFGAVYN